MIVHVSYLLRKSTRSSHRDAAGRTGDGGSRVDRKGLDGGRDRNGASEAGKEGGLETESIGMSW